MINYIMINHLIPTSKFIKMKIICFPKILAYYLKNYKNKIVIKFNRSIRCYQIKKTKNTNQYLVNLEI